MQFDVTGYALEYNEMQEKCGMCKSDIFLPNDICDL